MGFVSHCVTSPSWCYAIEKYNEEQNDYINTTGEKLVPEMFSWTCCVDCKEYREFTNNVCPYHPPMESHYHVMIAEKYVLIDGIFIKKTPPVVMIVLQNIIQDLILIFRTVS